MTIGRQSKFDSYNSDNYRSFKGLISEVLHYNRNLTADEIQKVRTYLALKYGTTLDNSGGGTAGNYKLSNDAIAWTAADNPSCHNQVIGIVKDNGSNLLQKQSHSIDDSLRIFVGSLAASNATNAGAITNNNSSIIIGNDGGRLQGVFGAAKPAGIYSRLGRAWKITNTNFTDNFSLEIKWDSVGQFMLSDLRLLVSSSPDFSSAVAYDGSAVTFSLGSIIVGNISNSVIPANSTAFITIGSANSTTTLPVKIENFTATVTASKTVLLNWATSNELNSEAFTVERSADGINWKPIIKVAAAGNSQVKTQYSAEDKQPYNGVSYYRLLQTDRDGKYNYSAVQTVKLNTGNTELTMVYPNPVSHQLIIKADPQELKTVQIFTNTGANLTGKVKIISNNGSAMVLDMSKLPASVYTIVTATHTTNVIKQ